ncbi:exoglucanase B-like [Anthonomus grandis grandis]|uniref:exoglucanase B-like n=1 Tax=Anthonomus grandis grandis TaxID=2921223 RepID=UPI002165C136|nr:exoglucanase B-like [Anthonomus grandis grandis]
MKLVLSIVLVAGLVTVQAGEYTQRFLELYGEITNSNNGYYSKEGIPYHSVETMMVESVDYGHETDSEALSYNIWLKAMYGGISGDFSAFNEAWNVIENYMIPETQYNTDKYDPSAAASTSTITAGIDPIGNELKSSYGDNNLRVMHWLLDVDNIYGFGNTQGNCELGPSANGPSFVNNGAGSLFQGITYPTCDSFKYGGSNGFSWYSSVPNWQYSAAPDADARSILGAYWASQWATQQGKLSDISSTLSKASKLGDYLRYTFFDKHFKQIGNCVGGTVCPAGTGKDSAHYLISWYIGWGGAISSNGGYSWRMCSGEAHSGYQNPITAYALVNDPNLKPSSASAVSDWQASLERQLEFYQWVQTSDGPLGGGVTNSWEESYADPPAAVKANTFYGMWYKSQPGYEGASDWFGMQSWSMDRLAQYYYLTGDSRAQSVLEKWVSWILTQINVQTNYLTTPVSLSWTGNTPWDAKASVSGYGNMIGISSSIARTLTYYAAKSGNTQAKSMAKQMLDNMWQNNRDSIGLSVTTSVDSLSQVTTKVYIPISGWTGVYPNGEQINESSTFLDIRSFYKNDPNWSQLQNYLNGGSAPKINYHRFWEQADMALALGAYGLLFNE